LSAKRHFVHVDKVSSIGQKAATALAGPKGQNQSSCFGTTKVVPLLQDFSSSKQAKQTSHQGTLAKLSFVDEVLLEAQ